MASESMASAIVDEKARRHANSTRPEKTPADATPVPRAVEVFAQEVAREQVESLPPRNEGSARAGGLPSGGYAPDLVANSLARRALCPDCVHLGGCSLGIPGLVHLPQRGENESITQTSKSYLTKLITNDVVAGYRLVSKLESARGETFVSGTSLCAAIKQCKITPGGREAA